MTFRKFTILTVSTSLLGLAACEGGFAKHKAPILDATINKSQNELKQRPLYNQKGTVEVQNGHYLGRKVVRTNIHRNLPRRLTEHPFVWANADKFTIDQIASEIRGMINLPVYVDNREYSESKSTTTAATDTAQGMASTNGILGGLGGNRYNVNVEEKPKIEILIKNYSGSFSGFLNQISQYFSYEWRFEDDVLYFDKFTTKLYMVKAPFGKQSVTSQFGGSTEGSGSISGSAGTSNSVEFDVWTEIEEGIKGLLPKGTQFSVSKSTGTLTVTARPNEQKLIAKYIKDMNAILSPRISIQVSAFLVDITDDDQYGFSLKSALEGTQGLSMGLSAFDTALSGLNGVATLSVLNSKAGTKVNHLEGSNALLRAVSSSNRLVDQWTATVVLQNNTPGPVNLMTDREYIKSVSVNNLADTGNTQVTTESATAFYGQSLQLVPRISGNDEIMISMSLNSAGVPTFENFSASNGTTVQTRTQAKRDLYNNVPIGNGETLVLSGFEQTTGSMLDEGIGKAQVSLLGGKDNANIRRTRLILLITPTIMQRPQNRDIGKTRVLHDSFDLIER